MLKQCSMIAIGKQKYGFPKLRLYLLCRYFPTKTNRRMRGVSREIEAAVRGIIVERERAAERGETIHDDLLGILMESNMNEIQEQGSKKMGLSIADVIEECKLFYFAGSETTSNLLVWTLVMLCKHPDWQARAREEVLQVLGKNPPTFDALNQLKTVSFKLTEVGQCLYIVSNFLHSSMWYELQLNYIHFTRHGLTLNL